MIAIDINIAVIGLVGRVYVSDVTKNISPITQPTIPIQLDA